MYCTFPHTVTPFIFLNSQVPSKIFVNEDRVAEGLRNMQIQNAASGDDQTASNLNSEWFTEQDQR